MTAPTLTPLDTPLFDDDVIADLEEHIGDSPSCEAPKGCDEVAVARFVVVCPCRKVRLGCAPHIDSTSRWFDQSGTIRCQSCGGLVETYRVIPL